MKHLREPFGGLLFALLTTLICLGALTVSLVEGMAGPTLPLQATETPFVFPTYLAIQTTAAPALNTPSATATAACQQPPGWVEYIVQFGDDLQDLAQGAGLTVDELREANCLVSTDLVAGTILFLPQSALTETSTPSPAPLKCGPPAGWITYRIQSSDTLFRISRIYGVSVPELQFANCMGSSTFLRTGDLIYVPNVATSTPEITPSGTNLPTQTSIFDTVYPTETPTQTPTPIPTLTSTDTETPTPDLTAESTAEPTP